MHSYLLPAHYNANESSECCLFMPGHTGNAVAGWELVRILSATTAVDCCCDHRRCSPLLLLLTLALLLCVSWYGQRKGLQKGEARVDDTHDRACMVKTYDLTKGFCRGLIVGCAELCSGWCIGCRLHADSAPIKRPL